MPQWARVHPEFEGVAGECIALAIDRFDPERGTFQSYLYYSARRHIPTTLARLSGKARLDLELDADLNPPEDSIIDSTDMMLTFTEVFGRQPLRARQVAYLLSEGYTQADCARVMSVSRAYVSKVVKSLREPLSECVAQAA